MKNETNEKVLAMYEAVCALIEDGCDLYNMKVSDITARAGIGKGTAYEYFRSKEEILVRALEYDFMQQHQELKKSVEQEESFHGAVERVFEWITRNICRKRLGFQTLKIIGDMQKKAKQKSEDCVMKKMKQSADLFEELLDYMVKMGKKEGIIRKALPEELARMELFSKFVGYYIYLQTSEKNETENRQMKEFLYETMVKSLS